MTNGMPEEPNRMSDLLADLATAGLTDSERAELAELLGPGRNEDSFEWAAAAVALAHSRAPAELPSHLRRRLEADISSQLATPKPPPRTPNRFAWKGWLGWAVAACLLVAFGIRELLPKGPTAAVLAPIADPATKRDELIVKDPGAIVLEGTKLPKEQTTGTVVWSENRQEGYLTLRDLPELRDKQFQLWIFDADRDTRYPVDGGVFDAATGEVVIPIRAAVQVKRATMFAITVEPPGGVVVSNRERIIWLAKAG